jgi:hypothetical protein
MGTNQKDGFSEAWPDLASGLHRILAGKKVPPAISEDIVQETGLRLLMIWKRIDRGRPLMPLCVTIALNLVRDQARRSGREVIGEVPERPECLDVEAAAIARLELARTAAAMAQLSPEHRLVLLDEVSGRRSTCARSRDAVKMLRLRARRRLCSLLEVASSATLGWTLRLRRPSTESVHPLVGAVAAMAFVTAVGAGSFEVSPPSRQKLGAPGRHASTMNRQHVPTRALSRSPSVKSSASTPANPENEKPSSHDIRPVHIPVGDGYAEGEANVSAGGVSIQVGDNGGPVPVCVGGLPHVPRPLACPSPKPTRD